MGHCEVMSQKLNISYQIRFISKSKDPFKTKQNEKLYWDNYFLGQIFHPKSFGATICFTQFLLIFVAPTFCAPTFFAPKIVWPNCFYNQNIWTKNIFDLKILAHNFFAYCFFLGT